MKFSVTYIKNLIQLNLIILMYTFVLNCSSSPTLPAFNAPTPPIKNLPPVASDCLNGEAKNAQGICVPYCNQNQVSENNTCINFSLPVDSDSNGLIDIYTLEDLDNVRFNLAGTSWKTSLTDTVWRTAGCPSIVGCRGYELKANLDFSVTKWASNCIGSCVSGGWNPIGTNLTPFVATFNGNGFEIRNLYINRSQDYVGLFGHISTTSTIINNIGVVNAYVKGSSYVGVFVGSQDSGSITNSYASGTVSGNSNTGGLVGRQQSGSITNSFANSTVSGRDYTGGLVGFQIGSITNSYASGTVTGNSNTGGLVGGIQDSSSSINNSYASGSVSGGDKTGGLVGYKIGGSITNSYASGTVSGSSNTGGLVGWQVSGSITNSYFVSSKGLNAIGAGIDSGGICSIPNCIKLNIEDLLTLNSPSLKLSFNTLNWDTNSRAGNGHFALLRTDGIRLAGQGIISNFDTVIKFKQDANSDYTKLLFGNKGSTFNLPSTYLDAGIINTIGLSFLGWSTNTPTNTISDTNNFFIPNSPYLIPASTLISLTFYPVFNLSGLPQIAGEDGLIWISTAVALYNIRYSLNGKYYQHGPSGFINTKGCPASGCRGYKLLNNIDFNTDNTAINWASNNPIGIGNNGWEPIGSLATPFTATFDGKGFEIRNLYINKPTQDYVGLFGYVSGTSTLINSVGVVKVYINGNYDVGGLLGTQFGGTITNSYASGSVSGSSGTGGLAGFSGGTITNSYASGSVSGTSYSTGGLVGYSEGTITNSYANSSVSGVNYTGGLVGHLRFGGSITNSFASGSMNGTDDTGGLVGSQFGNITNSFASGTVSSASLSGSASTGGLVGSQNAGNITNTYWNSMSAQTIAGVSRSEGLRLGIGNITWSTSSNSANGISALSTSNFFTNTFLKAGVSINILDNNLKAFYFPGISFPKLCYTLLPSGVACSATYRISGQD